MLQQGPTTITQVLSISEKLCTGGSGTATRSVYMLKPPELPVHGYI